MLIRLMLLIIVLFQENLVALHLILVQKYPLLVFLFFWAMKFSSIIDVLSLNRPSSFASFPSLKKGFSIVAFFGLEKNRFVVAFFTFEKSHFVTTFFDSSMSNTCAIEFSNPRTLLSTYIVIVPCPMTLLVVDSRFDVIQIFIFC